MVAVPLSGCGSREDRFADAENSQRQLRQSGRRSTRRGYQRKKNVVRRDGPPSLEGDTHE